jgi:hypothetical protein
MNESLEQLYQEARSALKAKNYERAGDLLRQILLIDENYKDASRLLARVVREKRRHWYNGIRLWGTVIGLVVIGLLVWIVPKLLMPATPASQAVKISSPATTIPTDTAMPTVTALPTLTPIPLAWKRIDVGQEFTRDTVTALVFDTKDPDILYADTQHAGIYISIDGGISWGPVQPNDLSNNPSYTILLQDSKDAIQDVSTFSNTAPDGIKRLYQYSDVVKGVSQYWYLSEDGGTSWSRFSEGGTYSKGEFSPIAFDKLGEVYVFCGNNICKFSPDGKPLQILREPGVGVQSVIALSPYDPNTIYAAGAGIAVSKDGGLTWVREDNGMGADVLQLEVGLGNPNFLYLLLGECFLQTDNQGIAQPLYLSSNGGAEWEFLTDAGCYLIKDVDGKTLYRQTETFAWGDSVHWIWRSSTSGKSWVKVFVPTAAGTLVADPKQSGVLFAYLDLPLEFITKNYGNSWEASPLKDTRPCYGSTAQFIDSYVPMASDPRNRDHVLFFDRGHLQESFDGCASYGAILGNRPDNIDSIAIDPNTPNTIYAGADSGAYVSFDSGKSWNQINDGLLGATVVYSIVVDPQSNVYTATPYGIFQLEKK